MLTGLAAGIAGTALTLILHLVQHLAFGYTEATFLTGVERATPLRRVLAVAAGGLIVGLGWWGLRRRSRQITSVTTAMDHPDRSLPLPIQTADAVLQIVAVGCGASLGREGAPRQMGAALGGWLAARMRLDVGGRRTILACGAGAGLAAVYDVPLGGALFTLEILLVSASVTDVVAAVLSSGVAALVAWPVLSNRPTYLVAAPTFDGWLVLAAIVLGPAAAAAGIGFLRLTRWARSLAPSGWRLPIATTVAFGAVGAGATFYPQLLGNGKGPAQLAFDGTLGIGVLAALIVLKPVATALCLGSGATGGLLTPALATGALLGALAGAIWNLLWPGAPVVSCALLGAAAVLSVTQRAPLCAVVLVLELTHTGLTLTVPLLLAVGTAMFTVSAVTAASSTFEHAGPRAVPRDSPGRG